MHPIPAAPRPAALPAPRQELVLGLRPALPAGALRRGDFKLLVNPGAAGGFKGWRGEAAPACQEADTEFAGHGIPNNRVDGVGSAAACRSACLARAECKYWTWNSASYPLLASTCWLKASEAGRRTRPGKVSGDRGVKSLKG